ncbi:hypothetical protein GCM10009106_08910 [Sphingomonas japonica]
MRLVNPDTFAAVELFSDDSGTPIVGESGIENAARSDDDGNLSLYVAPGTYHFDVYAPDGETFIIRFEEIPMSGEGPPGPKGDPGGSVAFVGLFPQIPGFLIEGSDVIQTSGYDQVGVGIAQYAAFDFGSEAANDAYVAANPRIAVKSSNARFFRLTTDQSVAFQSFGARPNAADNSDAWNAAVAFCQSAGVILSLAGGGTYAIPNATTLSLTSQLTVIGDGKTTLDGGDGVTLFKPVSAGFTFRDVRTVNVTLCYSFNEITTNIPLIDLTGWQPNNTLDVLGAVLYSRNDVGTNFTLDKLYLDNIRGLGGVGGVHMRCQVLGGSLDNSRWENISVPNTDKHFSGNNMIGTGYNSGFNIGIENTINDFPTLPGGFVVGDVTVRNVMDNRVQRVGGTTTNCDGVRIITPYTQAGSIEVYNVNSAYRVDTTGVYTKALFGGSRRLLLIDAGRHEAALTIKGNTREGPEVASPPGYGTKWDSVTIACRATGYNQRTAISLNSDDVTIGRALIENMGGDIEDPATPGMAASGVRGSIYSTSGLKRKLNLGDIDIFNNVLAGSCRLISLDGYRVIYIDRLYIDGASNAGRFAGVPTGTEQALQLIRTVATLVPIDDLVINSLVVKNLVKVNGQFASAIRVPSTAVGIGRISILGGSADSTLDRLIDTQAGGPPIGSLRIANFDLSAVGTPFALDTQPTEFIFNGAMIGPSTNIVTNGGFTDGTGWTTSGSWTIGGGVATHATGSTGNLDTTVPLVAGQKYMLQFTITGSGGNIIPSFQGGTAVVATPISTSGKVTIFMRALTGNNLLRIAASSSANKFVDDIGLYAVGN